MQYSNVVGVEFTTPKVYAYSNVVGLSFETTSGFGIVEADAFLTPGNLHALQVVGVTDEFSIVWSPTADPAHPGAVELDVFFQALDGLGNGTITVTGTRGAVRYGQGGYLILVMDGEQDSVQATLTAEAGLKWVNLTSVVPQWAQGAVVDAGDYCWNPTAGHAGRRYEAASSGTTGATPPTHGEGTMSDGGVSWAFTQAYTRIVADPDLQAGWQVAVNEVEGGLIGDINLNPDGTWDQASGVSAFKAGRHNGTSWSEFAEQTVLDWPEDPVKDGDPWAVITAMGVTLSFTTGDVDTPDVVGLPWAASIDVGVGSAFLSGAVSAPAQYTGGPFSATVTVGVNTRFALALDIPPGLIVPTTIAPPEVGAAGVLR